MVNVTISQPGAAPDGDGDADRAEGGGLHREHRQRAQHHHLHHRGFQVNIFLEFQIGTPIDRAVTDVRDAVAKVRNDLPHGIMEPLVQRQDVGRGCDLLLRGDHHRAYARGAQLVHRQHGDQAPAGRAGGCAGLAQRRREPRNPRRARSRAPAGARADGGGSQRSVAGAESRRGGRPRAGRRRRAGDPRARRREDARRIWPILRSSRAAADRCACARSRTCTTASPRCAPSRGSTAARRPPLASTRRRAPRMSACRRRSRPSSTRFAARIRRCT